MTQSVLEPSLSTSDGTEIFEPSPGMGGHDDARIPQELQTQWDGSGEFSAPPGGTRYMCREIDRIW